MERIGAHERRGPITMSTQDLGQEYLSVRYDLAISNNTVRYWVLRREQANVSRKCRRHGRVGVFGPNTIRSHLLQKRCCGPMITVDRRVVSSQCIYGDENNIRMRRRPTTSPYQQYNAPNKKTNHRWEMSGLTTLQNTQHC